MIPPVVGIQMNLCINAMVRAAGQGPPGTALQATSSAPRARPEVVAGYQQGQVPRFVPYPRNRKNGIVTRPNAKSMPRMLNSTRAGWARSNEKNVSAVPSRLAAA